MVLSDGVQSCFLKKFIFLFKINFLYIFIIDVLILKRFFYEIK
jgi:hypothetical protein